MHSFNAMSSSVVVAGMGDCFFEKRDISGCQSAAINQHNDGGGGIEDGGGGGLYNGH